MHDLPREFLIVLDADRPSGLMDHLRTVTHIIQVLEPRLALAECDETTIDAIAEIPGVAGVYGEPRPEFVPEASEAERMFVAAWGLRRRPKARPGDGLPWDAPGFTPPDKPGH